MLSCITFYGFFKYRFSNFLFWRKGVRNEKDLLWTFFSDGSARHWNIRAKDRIQPRQDRWCKFAIVPRLHILNEKSSNLLEYLVMLSSTHVHNIARCSIVWNAKTPFLVFRQKSFSRCTIKDKSVSNEYFFSTVEYCSLRSQTFYPNARIKWPGRIGVPPIPEHKQDIPQVDICTNTQL